MEDTKVWYMSRSVIGALVSMLSSMVLLTGHTIAPEMQGSITDLLANLGTLVGGALALYGRLNATKTITATTTTPTV